MAEATATFLARHYRPDTFVYHIDIVGTCNLGCASCPVGNMPTGATNRGSTPKGFMPVATFEAILAKILAEAPVPKPVIGLYNWGEPLLHPEIGTIVRLVRRHDLYCAVSTNLNQDRFLEDLVRAEPNNIKISLSGSTQAVYGRTHTKGRIERVTSNMRKLRALIDAHGVTTDVFVGYHDYVGNDGDELAHMEDLTRELGFGLRHKIARLSPLEKLLPLCHPGTAPSEADRAVYDLLLVKPHEWSALALADGPDTSCVMREQEMAINFDGSVSLCCNVFTYANNIAPDFLHASHETLQAAKATHAFCGPCMAAGFPKSCGLDAHPDVKTLTTDSRATSRRNREDVLAKDREGSPPTQTRAFGSRRT
jgi:MoaA/NifB/PqqE/SkfB family radical SAM enzyme